MRSETVNFTEQGFARIPRAIDLTEGAPAARLFRRTVRAHG
jgi:hypothetical protein